MSISDWRLSALLTSLVLPAAPVLAQQTIINVPSVDQTKEGKVFFLHESQVRDWGGNSFWLTTSFLTYGVTKRFEVALTAYNIGTPAAPNQAIGAGWKTAQPIFESSLPDWDLTLGAGQMVPINLRTGDVGVWSYGQAAVRIPGLGLRLMGGISNGPTSLFGQQTTHFISSFEQPLRGVGDSIGGPVGSIVRDMTLLGEWWSGTHELADFVPGVNWHSESGWVVVLGYKFSNKPGTKTDGMIIEVGKTF